MQTPHLVRSFIGLQSDPYEPGFDVQFTTYLQKYTDFRPHNFAIYFFHAFMGFVFTIPETELMDELGIEKIIYKPMKDKSGLKFVFLIKNEAGKKLMVVRNVFLEPNSKNWERGITSSEYEGLKKNLAGQGIDLDDFGRSIEEYYVREEKLYNTEEEHISRRRMSIYLQKLHTDVRMISSDEGMKTPDNNFKILTRVGKVLEDHPNLKTIENTLKNLKQRSDESYKYYIAKVIRELKTVYVNTQTRHEVQYDKWNGADCGFMHGAFLALESKLELLPIVRHVPAFKEFDLLSKGLYGRFYLSLIPKRSLALSDLNMYIKHRPLAMSFVQDISYPLTEKYLLRDRTMLAKHAVTGNMRDKMLLYPVHLGESLGEGIEMPINKHLDFLEQCSQHYNNIFGAQSSRSRQLMTDYVGDFLDSISPHMSSKDTRDVNYVSRYLLAMLLSIENREQSKIFAKKDAEKTFFVLKSKVEGGKTIVFEFNEHPMKDRSTSGEYPSFALYDEIAQGDALHVTIEENFRHTKEDLLDSEITLDLVSRKIVISGSRFTIPEDDLISLDPFNIERSLLIVQAASERELLDLFSKYHSFIENKHQLSAFVDGLFHNTKHTKNLLAIKPYQSHRQITCFHDNKESFNIDELMISHLNFFLTVDKDVVTDRKIDAIAAVKQASKEIKGHAINVLINNDPTNTNPDDIIHISHFETSDHGCWVRRKRSVSCSDEKPLFPKDMESSHAFPAIGNAVETLGQISGYLMSGLMLRDFISDLIRHDTIGAIRDGTFFVGGIFSHKLAATAETYGARMIEEQRILLGNSLKFAAPVLRRLTSAYVLSHLISSVRQYQNDKNDTAALVNVGVDSAFLTIDAGETSIEVMELFGVEAMEGISAITGPIGMAIGAVLILGSNVYETVKKMEMINSEVSLSVDEEITESLRAFFHLDTSQQVQKEISEYEANEILAKQINSQLNRQKKFKYYSTSSGRIKNGKIQMLNDTIIDLQNKNTFIKSKANPESYQLFCPLSISLREHRVKIQEEKSFWKKLKSLFTDTYWKVKTVVDTLRNDFVSATLDLNQLDPKDLDHGYACHNAFGMTVEDARSDSAFFQLGSGYDRVHGFSDRPNVYNFSDGQKVIYGGKNDDTFILNGNNIKGVLDGHDGMNTLDISRFNLKSALRMDDTKVVAGNSAFIAMNMNKVIGRENVEDVIEAPCSLTILDSKGGNNSGESDKLSFKNATCQYNVTVILSSCTKVYVDHMTTGVFNYNVKPDAAGLYIQTSHKSKAFITFNTHLTSITEINLSNNTFSLSRDNATALTLHGDLENFEMTFNDSVKLRVKSGHITVLLRTNFTVSNILGTYDEFLRLNNLSMIAFSTSDQKSVVFNHGRYEYSQNSDKHQFLSLNVIHNDPLHENHIVCSREQHNIVLIRKAAEQSIAEFKIPDIHIHCASSDLILDLSNISQTVCQKWPRREVKVVGSSDSLAKVLSVNVYLVSGNDSTVFGKLQINTDTMEKIKIINYDSSRIVGKVPSFASKRTFSPSNTLSVENSIVGNFRDITGKHTLIIAPDNWQIEKNFAFAVITECNIEWYQTVRIPREIDNFGVYRINETALVTNLDEKMIYDRKDLAILLLEDYFISDKLKSIRLIDVNRKVLNLNRPLSSTNSIDDLWNRFIANDNFYHNN